MRFRVRNVVFALLAVSGLFALTVVPFRYVGDHQPCTRSFSGLYALTTKDDLVKSADAILVGTVMSMKTRHENFYDDPCEGVFTDVEVRVDQDIFSKDGTTPKSVIVTVVGGKIGNAEVKDENTQPFSVGQKNVLFLMRPDSVSRSGMVFALMPQGRYVIADNGSLGGDGMQKGFLREIWGDEHMSLARLLPAIREVLTKTR